MQGRTERTCLGMGNPAFGRCCAQLTYSVPSVHIRCERHSAGTCSEFLPLQRARNLFIGTQVPETGKGVLADAANGNCRTANAGVRGLSAVREGVQERTPSPLNPASVQRRAAARSTPSSVLLTEQDGC